jgi:hypothetical protein
MPVRPGATEGNLIPDTDVRMNGAATLHWMRSMTRRSSLLAAACLFAGDGGTLQDTIAITDVSVVSMTSARIEGGRTVVVEGGKVRAIGPARRVPIPPGARRIDGRGAWLMPALTDMHVHLRPADIPAYLANGIGTVRNMCTRESCG